MKGIMLLSAGLALLQIASAENGGAMALEAPADLRGIYVYTEHLAQDSAALAQSLAVPGVDGVTLLQGWASLEPSLGQYRWVELDHWVNLAAASGKKVVLAIRAGQDMPLGTHSLEPTGQAPTLMAVDSHRAGEAGALQKGSSSPTRREDRGRDWEGCSV